MDDLKFILGILKVDIERLTELEINALMLYVLPSTILLDSANIKYRDHVKIERMISTIAFIMGTKVYDKKPSYEGDFKNDISAMGWTDDYIQDTIKTLGTNKADWWGHRLVNDWAHI